MADQGKVCVCPQCGKKYMLKEGFEAKSFSCKGCGATVWVAGKPPAPVPSSRGAAPAPRAATKGGRGGRAAPAAASHRPGRRSRRGEHEEEGAEGGRRGRRGYEKPKSNTNLYLAVGGGVVILGLVLFFALRGKDEKGGGQAVAVQPPGATDAPPTETPTGTPADTPAATVPSGSEPPANAAPGEEPKALGPTGGAGTEEPDASASPEGGETQKPALGDRPKGEKRKSPWDPPATLGHLDTTPPETRKQIDDLLVILLDPDSGREVHEAKEKLAAIGKPAFLPVLGKMAAIRDSLTDVDSMEEKRIESALMQADQCLRLMDGFLDSHDKGIIRPGERKEYIEYVLRMHYQRWEKGVSGSRPLKEMDTMPGPFDPTTMEKEEGGLEEDEK